VSQVKCGVDKPTESGLSRAQFEEAQRRGDHYWLYIVEHANTPERARVVRIQNPAGKAQTFTFDHGWLCVAKVDSCGECSYKEKG